MVNASCKGHSLVDPWAPGLIHYHQDVEAGSIKFFVRPALLRNINLFEAYVINTKL